MSMRLYREFGVWTSGAGFTLTDPEAYTASVKNTGGTEIEAPTPVRSSTGWYYVELTDALYSTSSEYDLYGTFNFTGDPSQQFVERFKPASGSGGSSGSGFIFAVRRNAAHAGPHRG